MKSYDRIYNLLTEVSIKRAARAAAKATVKRPALVSRAPGRFPHAMEPQDPKKLASEKERTVSQIGRIQAKFTQRLIKKHGEAGTKTVLGPPGEVPAELGGGRYERTGRQVTRRTLVSGGQRETRAETVSRKFKKALRK